MSSSRETILNKLRTARRPFEDAPPRPAAYLPVTEIDDSSPDGLIRRFSEELDRLKGQAFVAEGDDAARACVLDLLRSHKAQRILAWDFACVPVEGLEAAIRAEGIEIVQPHVHDERRPETLAICEGAQVGVTGVDAAVAATGTLVVTTAPGKGRIPTVLPPVHLAVVSLDQLVPRLEDWVAGQRAHGLDGLRAAANFCFITGPSRTGDIEMELILGVHGPGQVQVVIKR